MKKVMFAVSLVLVAVMALGVVSYAYAQGTTPNPQPYGPGGGRGGMMGGGRGGGMMGGRGAYGGAYGAQTGTYGPMHDYMEEAFADALGISEADVEKALASGKTMWQLAEEKGMTLEQFQKVMVDARTAALKKMVADGVITQQQADFMLSRMQNAWGQGGFGATGGCPGMGGGYGPGQRWNSPATTPAPSGNSY